MKKGLDPITSILIVLFCSGLAAQGALGETTVDAREEAAFSVKGTVVEIDSSAQVVRLKNEGGLELTFHAGEPPQMTGLSVGEEVSLEYLYNENYEKVIRSIKRASSSGQIST